MPTCYSAGVYLLQNWCLDYDELAEPVPNRQSGSEMSSYERTSEAIKQVDDAFSAAIWPCGPPHSEEPLESWLLWLTQAIFHAVWAHGLVSQPAPKWLA